MKIKGVVLDVPSSGSPVIVAVADAIDAEFIEFIRSEEYLDWLEDAYAGESDVPYAGPLFIGPKEYKVKPYSVKPDRGYLVGEEIEFDEEVATNVELEVTG